MNAEQTLKYWRDNLSCEEQVKRQLAEEYINAETKEEFKLLDDIRKLIYKNNINKPFVSIFDVFTATQYNEHDTLEEAISSLEYGSNEGLIMDIAVIDLRSSKMVWYQKFLGEEECQLRVNMWLKENNIKL